MNKNNKNRIPVDVIPSGVYCYTMKNVIVSELGFRIITIPCPYYKDEYCTHLETEIDDQVKICGINEDFTE